MQFKTEQEIFWAGDFGNEYVIRNDIKDGLSANIAAFSKILSVTSKVNSVIELGANIGQNIHALKTLIPNAEFTAVEINESAVKQLEKIIDLNIIHSSIFDVDINNKFNISLIKGVLIHINPDFLQDIYQKLYDLSDKYICIIEYYNPTPVEIDYRGHSEKLYKRDFAGEIMEKFKNLELVDYGFLYKNDNNFKYSDSTWFLLKKV
jgi:pseudaminic acid biosynthesis-associated methylase